MFQAIKNKTVIKLEYKSFKQSEPETHLVHPYLIKQYNNRWFLFGKIDKNEDYEISNFSLDRIVKISDTNIKLTPSTIENWDGDEGYFSDFIGVSKNGKVTDEIKLKVSEKQLPYLKTKPIHSSQAFSTNPNDAWDVTIQIIPNHEFYQLMLSFGDAVQIVSPKHIKNELVNKIKNALSKY